MTSSRHANLAIGDLLDILPDAVIMVDAGGLISYVNPAVHALLGYAPGEILDQPLTMLVPHGVREAHETMVERFRREGVPTMMGARPVLHALHCSGRLVPVSISLCNLALDGGDRVSVAVIHDVSAMQTHLDRATAQAETDPLTGLGNRVRLARRMQALLADGRPFGLLFLELDRGERLEGERRHTVGDETLRIAGRRLQAQVRNADLVVRLGGDEFAFLLDGLDDADQLRARALSAAASLMRPLRAGSAAAAPLGVHIGGAISPHHGSAAQALFAAAGQALAAAKQGAQVYHLAGEG